MTVQALAAAVVYFGDGVTTSYVVPFEVLSLDDLLVTLDGVPAASYTAAGAPTEFGVTVTFTTPPAVGVKIVLERSTPLTQDTVYTAHGPYRAKQHEADFDKLMLLAQEARYRIENPYPVNARDVTFDNNGTNYASKDLYNALIEVDGDFRNADLALTAATDLLLANKTDKTTQILSQDAQVLQVLSPTLADDVTLVPITNVPNGLVKLDGSGHIPGTLIVAAGLVFEGTWNPNVQGPNPPAGPQTNGDFWIFDAVGPMNLAENTNPTPHSVDVFINDQMIWQVDRWYYVHSASFQIITAAGVTFGPVGTIGSINVQNAIAELDASISQRFKEEGDEIAVYRNAGTVLGVEKLEYVLKSTGSGPRLGVAKKDVFGVETGRIIVFGADQSGQVAQNSSLNIRSADGVTMGRVGWLGDGAMYLISDRPGAVQRIMVTNTALQNQLVLLGQPDGSTLLCERGLVRFGVYNGGVLIYSSTPNTDPVQTAQHTFQTSDGVTLGRIGFLGGKDMWIAVDTPGIFRMQVGTAEMQVGPTGLFHPTDLIAGRNAMSLALAPTAAHHLTRKDYVDGLLAGAGSYDSPQTVVTAAFTAPHGFGQAPRQHWATLVCIAPQAGYAIGDSIEMPLPYTITIPAPITFGYATWADTISIGFTRGNAPPNILPKGGGAAVSLLETSWRVVLHARK